MKKHTHRGKKQRQKRKKKHTNQHNTNTTTTRKWLNAVDKTTDHKFSLPSVRPALCKTAHTSCRHRTLSQHEKFIFYSTNTRDYLQLVFIAIYLFVRTNFSGKRRWNKKNTKQRITCCKYKIHFICILQVVKAAKAFHFNSLIILLFNYIWNPSG